MRLMMGRALQVAALLAAALPRPPQAVSARPCSSNALCVCHTDHLTCDFVPFHRFPDTEPSVRHVGVSGGRLGALGEAALDGRALRTLLLVASRLHRLEPTALSSMESTLASLDLGYNEFTEIPIEALRELKVLNWLNLQNNFINVIDPDTDWGSLADTLSSLSLSNNHICVIREGALNSLHHLAQLELDGNRLRQLDAGALPLGLALLRLSDNLLSRIPCPAIALLPRLRHLHLRNNVLRPASNRTCRGDKSKIDSLDLSHNELTDSFEFEFQHGLQLKQLILDLNDFTSVPSFVLDCGRLEKLSISYNKLSHLSDAMIFVLKHDLERLDLDYNELVSLPTSIKELVFLKHLSIAYNRLDTVQELPPRLHSLSLAGNMLSSFPTGLKTLSPASLVYLDLGYNLITQISLETFGSWSETLSTLSLRGNRVAQLSVGVFPPLPVRELVLSFNDLYYVESGVFANLTQLRVLELSSALFSGDVPAGFALETLSWLGLDNNNIHYFSSGDMQNFPSLEYLNLDFNKIIEFPSDVVRVNGTHKLKELRLSYNYISKINSEFLVDLKELQSVDLSYNRLHNISERSFLNLFNLVYLSLAGNIIEVVSDRAFCNLSRLEVLDLQENDLVEFSTRYLDNVSNDQVNFAVNVSYNRISLLVGGSPVLITVIDLSHNEIETISKNFFDSMGKHIRQVLLSHNKITQVDNSGFGSLSKLDILNLAYNNISALKRRSFADMVSLQILDLSNNRIAQMSVEQFYNLRRLRQLRLDANRLRALPRDAFKNTLLEYLDLGDNQLALFPSSTLAQVGFTLRRLELSRNRLEYLDAAMFQSTAFLHELSLAENALTVLSDNTLAGLPRLRRLDLSYNAIKANFKELFHNVPRLRRLSMAGAGLKSIPHLPLVNLTDLDLSINYITSYRESDVRHLGNLQALNLAGNKFTTVRPAMWVGLPRLNSLDISHNPVVRLTRGAFEGLERLLHLRMENLRHLETIEPRSFRPLISLRSIALESQTSEERNIPIAEIVSATPHLESLTVLIRDTILDSQLFGLQAPKLRIVDIRGRKLERVAMRAFMALGRQRALSLRLTGTAVTSLPAGLARPLAHIPHLALDFSNNRLVTFGPFAIYPNLTGVNRFATKLVPGGLVLANNPLHCGCSAAWVGAWLRRWTAEVGGGSRGAREAARRSTCLAVSYEHASPHPRPLLELHADEVECHASALSSRSSRSVPFSRDITAIVSYVLVHLNTSR